MRDEKTRNVPFARRARVWCRRAVTFIWVLAGAAWFPVVAPMAQTAPSSAEIENASPLHRAAAAGDTAAIARLAAAPGAELNGRDDHGRTPLMVAAHGRKHDAARALIAAGADLNALDSQRYDVLTISGVLDDVAMVRIALAAEASAKLVTSPYDGTALIASAHLGHVEVVRALIAAEAPLDHVNNLGWTALIEAIVLGDGGKNHTEIVGALIEAGAKLDLADSRGETPLALARGRGYGEIAALLERAGAGP